jgi:hypothetical protein
VYTFLGHLELSALGNLDGLYGLVTRALGHVLNLVDDLVAFKNLAEDDVAAIEPAGDNGGNEELTRDIKSESLKYRSFHRRLTFRLCPCLSWPC